jgi:soluble cytochrome b562
MRRLSPILIALALVIAGCGSSGSTTSSGPTTAEFKTAYSAQKVELKALGEDVGTAVAAAPKKSDAALTSEFQALASRATALAGSFGQLSAPTQYEAELATLQSSITQVAGSLHSIEAAAAAGDTQAAKAAAESLVADAQQVKSADSALSAKLGLPLP